MSHLWKQLIGLDYDGTIIQWTIGNSEEVKDKTDIADPHKRGYTGWGLLKP